MIARLGMQIRRDLTGSGSESGSRYYALCGMAAPVFFASMVVIEQLAAPNYNLVSQPISDLGAYALYGSLAILQNLNFWIFGLLIVTFALGLRRAILQSWSASLPLALFGAGAFFAGFFPDQPIPFPGQLHNAISILSFIALILAQFLTWRALGQAARMDGGRKWKSLRRFSLVSGAISFTIFLVVGQTGGAGAGTISGLKEIAFLATPFAWIEVMAFRLLRP